MDSNLPRLQLELYKEIKKVNQIAFSLWDLDLFSQETKMCLAPFFTYDVWVYLYVWIEIERERNSVMKVQSWKSGIGFWAQGIFCLIGYIFCCGYKSSFFFGCK